MQIHLCVCSVALISDVYYLAYCLPGNKACLHSLLAVTPKSTGILRSLENPEAGNGKESFKISKVTAVRPDNLVIPHFIARNDAQENNDNAKTLKSTLRTIIENKVSKDPPVHRYISVMNPVRSLPRSSHLIKMEKQKSLSRENIGSSSDSLNEGSQKKARLKIPKPSKQVTIKSRSEDKERKKKEDGNNNSEFLIFVEKLPGVPK